MTETELEKQDGGSRERVDPKTALKGALVLAAIMLFLATSQILSAPLPQKPERIIDDETVYALLDAKGGVNKTIVVDWLRVEGNGLLQLTDSGDFTNAQGLRGDTPDVGRGRVSWTLEADGAKDIYYRADTKKELPVDVAISYSLDGTDVEPERLAGESGHLKIDISVTNKLKKTVGLSYLNANGTGYAQKRQEMYVPLLAVVSMSLKAARFKNIETEDAMLSVTGETMSYTWMLFPQGEQEISIEMDGRPIEIEPIIISVFPQMPETPEIAIADEFGQMKQALDQLALLPSAHMEILDGIAREFDSSQFEGVSEASAGLALLGDGIAESREGAAGLVSLVEGQIQMLDGIVDGIDTEQFAGISELAAGITELSEGVLASKTGLDGLVAGLEGHVSTLDQLIESNDALSALAADAASRYPDDDSLAELADSLEAQGATLTFLKDGGDVAGQGHVPGLVETKAGLAEIAASLGQIAAGLDEVAVEAEALEQVPAAFSAIKDSLVALRDGGTFDGTYVPGLTFTLEGVRGLSGGLAQMEGGFEGMGSELGELEELPQAFAGLAATLTALRDGGRIMGQSVPGIAMTKEALEEMARGVGEGLEEIRAGDALKETMRLEAQSYDTFLGKPPGAEARVRFLLKTEAIKR